MFKLLVSGATALLSVGALSGTLQQPNPDEKTASKVEVKILKTDGSPDRRDLVTEDPSEPLRSAYIILRQLREQRLEERPKELADRAIVLYRDGVKAFESGDEAKARSLGSASLNLARAIELTRQLREGDPDLPPPPPTRVRVLVDGKKVADGKEIKGDKIVIDLPPLLDGDLKAEAAAKVKGQVAFKIVVPKVEALGGGVTAQGDLKPLILSKDGDVRLYGNVVVTPKAEVRALLKDAQKRAFTVEIPKGAAPPEVMLRKLAGDRLAFRAVQLDAEGRARIALQHAFDRIQAAREASKSDEEARVYLDAAKDLYNTARRDAEAGRHDRAAELAQAADSLARVPALLRDTPKDGDELKEDAEGPQAGRRIELKALAGIGEPSARVQIEKRIKTEGPEGKQEETVEARELSPEEANDFLTSRDEGEQVVGIGVSIEKQDGQVVVRELIPGSPAAESGKLAKGDRITAVKVGDAKVVELEGKELSEIVELIRGQAGTEVHIIVLKKDGEKPRDVMLERKALKVDGPKADGPGREKHGDVKSFRFVVPGIEAGANVRIDAEGMEKLKELVESRTAGKRVLKIEDLKGQKTEGDSKDRKAHLPPEIED